MRKPLRYCLAVLTVAAAPAVAQTPWVPDQGDGAYKNPVIYADYSDPDVIRVDDDYYMTSSSFSNVPGLPILQSRDLVNWRIIGHAIQRLPERFDKVQHGNGIWAPCLRYHDGHYWIFVGDPDWGILMTKAKSPAGPWSPLHVVQEGKGLIDPSPLWDDDGRAYLVHAYARSRSGRKSILVVREMVPDGTRLLGEEKIVIDGRPDVHPTIEGPKFYKFDDRYYILAPAGGVKPGWQLAARADSPFGPYEVRRVLEQGSTDINGPHQGGLVVTPGGQWWFLHFQDRDAYGRIVHLNPVNWRDGWPEMGVDYDGNGVGEPVRTFQKPAIEPAVEIANPQTTDLFDGRLNLAWQWQANPQQGWHSLKERPGWLRLHAHPRPATDLTDAANILAQKFPAPAFTATIEMDASKLTGQSEAGLVVTGLEYAGLLASRSHGGVRLHYVRGKQGGQTRELAEQTGMPVRFWLRATVRRGAVAQFSYSTNGRRYEPLGDPFPAAPGRWIGAKVGLVCLGQEGAADFASFTVAEPDADKRVKPVTVVLVGDSTVASNRDGARYQGWGWSLQPHFGDRAVIKNHAANGRSSKSFRSEGRWAKALEQQPDYVLIQFGHNDNPGKGPERETDPSAGGDYRDNLRRYIREAREAGATPILVTPTTRRFYGDDGQIDPNEGNVPYAQATLAVARETGCPVIDLNRLTRELFNRLGEQGSGPLQPRGDRTHFTETGSRRVASIVAAELASKSAQLAELIELGQPQRP